MAKKINTKKVSKTINEVVVVDVIDFGIIYVNGDMAYSDGHLEIRDLERAVGKSPFTLKRREIEGPCADICYEAGITPEKLSTWDELEKLQTEEDVELYLATNKI